LAELQEDQIGIAAGKMKKGTGPNGINEEGFEGSVREQDASWWVYPLSALQLL
jgi:hypothetical protein